MMAATTRWLTVLGVALGCALAAACGPRGPATPAPPPHRPEAQEPPATPQAQVPQDCQPVDPSMQAVSVAYADRSIDESANLARSGVAKLVQAQNRQLPRSERETLVIDAVELLITSLKADPYNVHATYNLASAYARVGRAQCAVNLLERLVELRKLDSYKEEVEDKIDRLQGRGKYKNNMDPDFYELRDDPRFRDLATRL